MPKKTKEGFDAIFNDLIHRLDPLRFAPPIQFVYNPLIYAQAPHRIYWQKYGRPRRGILLLGMNPGPWGMAQTGIPFGDVGMVSQWLDIRANVETPPDVHPKRPVLGFDCPRGEVSGQRLWGWARQRFGTPERFFKQFFVVNYCPLMFMEQSGRNRTPDKLPRNEKLPLLAACDTALMRIVGILQPQMVLGVGTFAAQQARRALHGMDVRVGRITHPSPANPRANAGWTALIERELTEMGIEI